MSDLANTVAATILICDDQKMLRALIREALEGGGRELAEASDGTESIELARRLRPDVVVLDMVMPDYSGLDVLVELRADRALAGTAVVLLSGANALSSWKAAELGVDRIMLKPFSIDDLRTTIDELLA